jgi:urease accessory protein UreH
VQEAHLTLFWVAHHHHPGAPLWVDETHVDRRYGEWVFLCQMDAVNALVKLIRHKRSQIADAMASDLIERLVRVDHLLAVVSIQDAAQAGVSAKKLAKAEAEVAKGDQAAAKGSPVLAIEHYRNAWEYVARLEI